MTLEGNMIEFLGGGGGSKGRVEIDIINFIRTSKNK